MLLVDNLFSLDGNGIRGKDSITSHTHLVSHGHFDHLPGRWKGKKLMSSSITKKMVELRKKKTLEGTVIPYVQMLPAGHTLGSTMFYFREHRLLFTGDFNTVQKYCGQARPRRCDTLVIEATYGDPRYVFPDYEETITAFLDYVKDNRATVDVYPFGKAQEVCHLLDSAKIPFAIQNRHIKAINDHLGLTYAYEDPDAEVVLGKERLEGHQHVKLTGWAIDGRFGMRALADQLFPLSDHADFPSLLRFVKQCRPKHVITFHGFAKRLAHTLQKQGYDAQELFARQRNLQAFF